MEALDTRNLIEALIRWLHVIAGIVWIGHLYFFNWVNANFAPTLDAETKKKVVPELMPRALYFFRWGAAFTWITGVLLLGLVYYMARANLFEEARAGWSGGALGMLAVVFLGVFAYDALFKAVKEPKAQFALGVILSAVVIWLLAQVAGFSYRGYAIHLGALFGTIMAYNVWFRIWPAQKQIIGAVKNGQAPDAALVALAGMRSKHNTYMSVPLLFAMLGQHATWASSRSGVPLMLVVLVGFLFVFWVYGKAKTVKGF